MASGLALGESENDIVEFEVERHPSYASTVRLASARFPVTQSRGLSRDASCTSVMSSRPLTQTSVAWSARSSQSQRIRRSAISIRPWTLPRTDGFPCPTSGRRTICADNASIRIFVRLPGKAGRMAVWVHPEWPVGPGPKGPENRFTDIWGFDDVPHPGRLSPLRELLHQQDQESHPCLEASPSLDTMQQSWPEATRPRQSLKGVIAEATGIPVAQQRLVFGRIGPLDDEQRSVCDYDIGHGALIYLSTKLAPREQRQFLASPALAKTHDPASTMRKLSSFLKRRKGFGVRCDPVVPIPNFSTSQTV